MNCSNENYNFKVDYLDFDDLEDFEYEEQLHIAIKNIKVYLSNQNSEWTYQFEAINDLRKLNKFYPRIFLEILSEICHEYVKSLISIRSNIAKISLIVLKEFYGNEIYFQKNSKSLNIMNANSHINGMFDLFLPSILLQGSGMKAFLKEEASQCLENIKNISNNLYFLKKLIDQINNKNISYSEIAFNTAYGLIENIFSTENSNFPGILEKKASKGVTTIKDVVEVIVNLYNLKKDIYSKKAVKLMNHLKDKLGNENFECVKDVFDNSTKINIDLMTKDFNKNTKTVGNFKDYINFIKSKKK